MTNDKLSRDRSVRCEEEGSAEREQRLLRALSAMRKQMQDLDAQWNTRLTEQIRSSGEERGHLLRHNALLREQLAAANQRAELAEARESRWRSLVEGRIGGLSAKAEELVGEVSWGVDDLKLGNRGESEGRTPRERVEGPVGRREVERSSGKPVTPKPTMAEVVLRTPVKKVQRGPEPRSTSGSTQVKQRAEPVRKSRRPRPKACHECGSLEHLAIGCPRRACRHCKAEGHLMASCPKLPPLICWGCAKRGHVLVDCPNPEAH